MPPADTLAIDEALQAADPPANGGSSDEARPRADTLAIDEAPQAADPPANGGSSDEVRPPADTLAIDEAPQAADPPANGGRSDKALLCARFMSVVLSMFTKLPKTICSSIINMAVSYLLGLFVISLCWLLYFRPNKLHPQVDVAVLGAFDLASSTPAAGSNKLLYDLTLNITFFNKHSKSKIHFEHLSTALYYSGTQIGPTDDTFPSFSLKRKGYKMVNSAMHGRASNVSTPVVETFVRERAQGQFNLIVRIKTTLTFRFFPHAVTYFNQYDCWLQFPPVTGDGTPAVIGGGFNCGVAK